MEGLLEAKNRKIFAVVTFQDLAETRVERIMKIFKEALEIDKLPRSNKSKLF